MFGGTSSSSDSLPETRPIPVPPALGPSELASLAGSALSAAGSISSEAAHESPPKKRKVLTASAVTTTFTKQSKALDQKEALLSELTGSVRANSRLLARCPRTEPFVGLRKALAEKIELVQILRQQTPVVFESLPDDTKHSLTSHSLTNLVSIKDIRKQVSQVFFLNNTMEHDLWHARMSVLQRSAQEALEAAQRLCQVVERICQQWLDENTTDEEGDGTEIDHGDGSGDDDGDSGVAPKVASGGATHGTVVSKASHMR